MKLLVILVLFVAVCRLGLSASALHVELSSVFRTDRAQGKQPFEVFSTALRTGGDIALTDQLFERMSTFSTGVFVNRHSAASIPRHGCREKGALALFSTHELQAEFLRGLLAGKPSPNYTCAAALDRIWREGSAC